MGWALVIALTVAAFAVLAFVLKVPRKAWEAIAAALVFGLLGFQFQASPAQPGAPKQAAETQDSNGKALVEARQQLAQGGPVSANRWMVTADGLSRRGHYADAAGFLLGAVEEQPNNAEAWLSLANNLVAHAEGNLTPAAQYAYSRAIQADPEQPGAPFFLGLALANSGKLDEGRAMWAALLARTPANAPWRKDLEARLADLDAFIARQQGQGGAQ